MIYRISFIVIFCPLIIMAQENKNINFNLYNIEYLSYCNTKSNKLPGYNVSIIMGDKDQNIDQIFHKDTLKNKIGTSRLDFSYFYYIPYKDYINENNFYDFLEQFIKKNHDLDFFDRNRVLLYLNNNTSLLNCNELENLNKIVAGIIVNPDSQLTNCNNPCVFKSDSQMTVVQKRNLKTTKQYEIVTYDFVNKIQENQIFNKEINIFKNDFFVSLSMGYHNVAKKNQTEFDNETLIDFAKINTYWNLNFGYYLNNNFGLFANFGLIYSGKEKNIESVISNPDGSISINGSGQAGAIYKIGFGSRFIPLKKDRITIFTDFSINHLKAIAGGGKATRTIFGSGSNTSDIVKKKEKTISYDLSIGTNYRVTNAIYFLGNIQFDHTTFKNPIGSVEGFGGISLNLGIGYNFNL